MQNSLSSALAYCAPRRLILIGSRLLACLIIMLTIPSTVTLGAEPTLDTAPPRADIESRPLIESGFRLLYELKFREAREEFVAFQKVHAGNPLGDVSVAASYLFEEFYHQGVLKSEFFLDDKRLLGGIEGKPDQDRKSGFDRSNQSALLLARSKIKVSPQDVDALFALTLATGMQADYASILEKRPLEGLRLIKEANGYANQLLGLRPDMADAWVALGAANYIIGCLPVHVRFLLWFGNIHGDKNLGMAQVSRTAENGRYLRPFAKIMLALAAIREKQEDVARKQLSDLVAEFPNNPLFTSELARLNQ